MCRLTPSNVLGIRNFAETLMCSSLYDECTRYVNKNFIEVVKGDEFLEISIKELCDILESDELHVANEVQVR